MYIMTIPIIKQAGPMISNMRSMVKLASIFKDETDNINGKTNNKYIHNAETNNVKEYNNNNNNYNYTNYDNSPTFFVN